MRNSTRTTAPPGSLAVADSGTAAPAVNDWPLVGAVSDTVGARIAAAAHREGTARGDACSTPGCRCRPQVAVTVWLPSARPVGR